MTTNPCSIKPHQLKISFSVSPEMAQALNSLEEISKRRLESFHLVLDRFNSGVQLFRIDIDSGTTTATGELRAVAQPSDALLDLLAACRAFEGQ